jgi:hypothetical protein
VVNGKISAMKERVNALERGHEKIEKKIDVIYQHVLRTSPEHQPQEK